MNNEPSSRPIRARRGQVNGSELANVASDRQPATLGSFSSLWDVIAHDANWRRSWRTAVRATSATRAIAVAKRNLTRPKWAKTWDARPLDPTTHPDYQDMLRRGYLRSVAEAPEKSHC